MADIIPEVVDDVDFSQAVEVLQKGKSPSSHQRAATLSSELIALIDESEKCLLKASIKAYEFNAMFGWEVLGYSSLKAYSEGNGISTERVYTLIKIAEKLVYGIGLGIEELSGIPLRKLRLIATHADSLKANKKMDDILSEARQGSSNEFSDVVADAIRPPEVKVAPISTPERTGREQSPASGGAGGFDPTDANGPATTTNTPGASPIADPRQGGGNELEFPEDDAGRIFMKKGVYVLSRLTETEARDMEEKISQGSLQALQGRCRMYRQDAESVFVKVS